MLKVFVDMDGVLCDFAKSSKSSMYKYPQSKYGFFRELEPIGLEQFKTLATFNDVYIATAPSINNPLSYTEKAEWIKHHLGLEWLKRMIIIYDKSLLIGDVLIDDHVSGRGQNNFKGKLIHYGSATYPDWDSILEKLI